MLKSAPSLLRVKDSRSGARGRVKAEADLPNHSGGLRTFTVACVAVYEDKTYSSEQQYSASDKSEKTHGEEFFPEHSSVRVKWVSRTLKGRKE